MATPGIADRIVAAWARVHEDCGCRDLYYCPSSDDIECQRHGGFDTCCAAPDAHVPVRPYLAAAPD